MQTDGVKGGDMRMDNLELLNDLFDGLEPEEQQQFVIQALNYLGIEVASIDALEEWQIAFQALRELGFVKDGEITNIRAGRL